MSGLAKRRHDKERMKARAKRLGRILGYDPQKAPKYADHITVCSCWMCGNPRRFFAELTMPERRLLAARKGGSDD